MNKIKIIAVAIAGAIMVFAFAPFSYWWLTLICPAILYFCITGESLKSALYLGLIFGLFFFGFGVPWTYNSIHEFGHAPILLSALLSGLLVLCCAVFPAMASCLYAYVINVKKYKITGAIFFAAAWVISEWVRGWIFTGFPWLLVGHVHHSSFLQSSIPVLGSYGASWLTLLISSFIVVLMLGEQKQKIISFVSMLFIYALLFLASQITWTQALDDELNVVLVQGNIPQHMKFDESKHAYIMGKYLTLSEDHFDADIIVWPETAIPTYYQAVKDTFIKELSQIGLQHDIEFLIGLFTYNETNGEVYNSVMALGEHLSFYEKQHLVAFGEYMPLRGLISIFDRYIDVPMSDLSKGQGRPLVQLQGHMVGTSICYEAVFGNEIIRAMPEAKFLINVSNDAWFGDSLAPHQHLEIARSRALETGRYLLRATNTGVSAIIDPMGAIVDRSVQFKENTVRAKIQPYSGITPYSRWGNWVIVTILFSILIIIWAYRNGISEE